MMRNYQLLAIGYKQTEVFRGRVHKVQNPRWYLRSGATHVVMHVHLSNQSSAVLEQVAIIKENIRPISQ